MIRVLIAIAILFAAVFALDWLGTVPLSIAIEWPGGVMAPPLRVVVVVIVVFTVAAILLWRVLSGIVHGPDAVRGFFRARRRDRGYSALSRGMIAVGSGDVRLAHRYAEEARKILTDEPMVLLLQAQTAQLEGRGDAARAAFNRMLDTQDTRLLGLRGLFIEATRAGETDAARHYAAEAQRLSPGVPWAGTAMMEYQSREQDWAGALASLESNISAKLIDKAAARRMRAVLLTARAEEAEDTDPERSRAYALEAHRLAPEFVPAAVVAARLLTRQLETRKAAKVIETTWRIEPHPELAEVYLHVRTGDSARDRLKRARMLEALKPHHPEGAITVARAALDTRDFALARAELAKVLRQHPTQRVCLMMAELEEIETGDAGRVREWLSRAVRAPRDEAWTADGVVSQVWLPASPVTGRLDAFEWRVPVATDSGVTELDGSDLAERAIRPLPAPIAAETGPHEPDDEPRGGGRTEPLATAASPKPGPQAETEPKPIAEPAVAALEPVAPKRPSFVEFPLTSSPDDPGPQQDRPPERMVPTAAFS
jgi:HemY protein